MTPHLKLLAMLREQAGGTTARLSRISNISRGDRECALRIAPPELLSAAARSCARDTISLTFDRNMLVVHSPGTVQNVVLSRTNETPFLREATNFEACTMAEYPRQHVLSIQSHVVSGYVGNKSATFPLQLLGYEVDAINSVQLSNHTGYKVVKGQILNDGDLGVLVDGLEQNNLDSYSHLLTGYVGSASFLKRIAQLVPVLKKKNPNLIYVCDPVMGDNGKMYVPEELKDIYVTDIVPLADILTPNQFELELLTGRKINTMSDLKDAVEDLHLAGPKIVAVSSTEINDKLTAVVSSAKDKTKIKLDIPRIPATYTGSGDLFAALFLAHSDFNASMKTALEKTINTLNAVLLKTHESCLANKDEKAQGARKIELRLIQSKTLIENPPRKLIAEIL